MRIMQKENIHQMTSERHSHRLRMASPDIESHQLGGMSVQCACGNCSPQNKSVWPTAMFTYY